jgi:signal transduction histidine kinase
VSRPEAIPRRPRRSDVLLAAAVGLVAQVETWASAGYEPKLPYAAAALALAAPLAWRRVAPLRVLVAIFVPLVALRLAREPLDSSYVMLVLLVAFAAAGAYRERRGALLGLGVGLGLLAILTGLEMALPAGGEDGPTAGDFVFIGAIVSIVWALAVALRDRSDRAGELEERADRLEREREERARAAVAEERARIARELHDVVAHSIGVIAVQTGSVRRRLRHERPDEARDLSGVEETARQALAEMRRMLGLLRANGDAPALAPQPGMDELDRLVERVREAGVEVELEVGGEHRPLPPGVDLAAYRIVQEALTNVIKHAGPARATVAVRYGERELEVEVRDDGRGASASDGRGHGLVGMRERAALYGGQLDAGPAPGGGYAVRARLPVTAA